MAASSGKYEIVKLLHLNKIDLHAQDNVSYKNNIVLSEKIDLYLLIMLIEWRKFNTLLLS